jgi:ribose transport system substrate-binding protein
MGWYTRRMPFVAAGVCALMALAACSSSSATSNSSSGSAAATSATSSAAHAAAEAAALVAKDEAAPALSSPPPAFDASKAKGKTVAWISTDASIGATTLLYNDGFLPAAKKAGIKVKFFDGQGQANVYVSDIDQAITDKVNAIVLQSIPDSLVSAPMAAAEKAGIPVIESFVHTVGQHPGAGASAEVTFNVGLVGKEMADAAIAEGKGKVDGVIFNSSDVGIAAAQVQAIQAELARLCPKTCSAKVVNVPVANWASQLPSATTAAIADPNVNFLFPLYDHECLYIVPAVNSAHAQGRVHISTFNASPDGMGYLSKGNVVVADVGSPDPWAGWAMMDETLRVLAGTPPVADEGLPYRLFTPANLSSININGSEANWYGGSDYQTVYLKQWGLG